MWFSTNVWATYGIALAVRDDSIPECTVRSHHQSIPTTEINTDRKLQTCMIQPSQMTPTIQLSSQPALPFQTPLPTGHRNESSTSTPSLSHTAQTLTPSTLSPPPHHTEPILRLPPSHPPSSFATLSPSAKAGIITGPILALLLTFLLLLLEYGYLRRLRRERALRRAVEEVERGDIEMAKRGELGGCGHDASLGESKENMVLESRVEIVVEEGSESGEEGEWDADADGEGDGEEEEEEEESEDGWSDWGLRRGRCAMSLPRREY
ncbi:hypothetical protein IQ07DRAFT_653211 [Pyrenochaeta sp. DS3sAY3a]|nr:hypothetical protein IQ07DRAFT_653211 [Pyrenochaeta sp. DS3sAY3a]